MTIDSVIIRHLAFSVTISPADIFGGSAAHKRTLPAYEFRS